MKQKGLGTPRLVYLRYSLSAWHLAAFIVMSLVLGLHGGTEKVTTRQRGPRRYDRRTRCRKMAVQIGTRVNKETSKGTLAPSIRAADSRCHRSDTWATNYQWLIKRLVDNSNTERLGLVPDSDWPGGKTSRRPRNKQELKASTSDRSCQRQGDF